MQSHPNHLSNHPANSWNACDSLSANFLLRLVTAVAASFLLTPQVPPPEGGTPWTMASMEDRVLAYLLAAFDASAVSEKRVWCDDAISAFGEERWAAIDLLASLEDRKVIRVQNESIDTNHILDQRDRLKPLMPEACRRVKWISTQKSPWALIKK